MHIFVPVSGLTFAQARRYSEFFGKQIHELVPSITTTSITKSQRGNKVLIDPSQNDYADTLASVYSVRPYHLPTVSTPLDWKEVKSSLDPSIFNIDTIAKRLQQKSDLFEKVHDAAITQKNVKMLSKIEL
jgi:bifunctional non-homologous end joining protein LigD